MGVRVLHVWEAGTSRSSSVISAPRLNSYYLGARSTHLNSQRLAAWSRKDETYLTSSSSFSFLPSGGHMHERVRLAPPEHLELLAVDALPPAPAVRQPREPVLVELPHALLQPLKPGACGHVPS